MKKLMISLILMIAVAGSAKALNSSDARSIALFLTDKMAYELNLTSEQYQAAYEVNYDYFLNLGGNSDLYGSYWNRRNLDLSYILGSTKYARFKGMYYFYRPAYWNSNRFRYRIYSRYANRNKMYFSRPVDYSSYNGEHSWRSNNNQSYFKGKDLDNGSGMRSSLRNGNNSRQNMTNNGNNRTGSKNNNQNGNDNRQNVNNKNNNQNGMNNNQNGMNNNQNGMNNNRNGNNQNSSNHSDQRFGNGNSQNNQNSTDHNNAEGNRP